MPDERRQFVRLNALVDVSFSRKDSLSKNQLSISKNISENGICVIFYEEVRESELLDLKIYIPESKIPIDVVGRVVWVKEFVIGDIKQGKRYDAGIEFIEVKDADRAKIDKYVFAHL